MFGRRKGGAAEPADESWAADMAAYEEVGRVRPVHTEAVVGDDVEAETDDLEPVVAVAPEAPAPAAVPLRAAAPAQKDHKKNYVAAGAGLLAMAAVRAWRKRG